MNVLIVGLGSIAHKHVIALNSLEEDFEIYALRSSKDADVYPGIINVTDLEEIAVPVDFAIISNPTHLHAPFIDLLADRGVHLFIEKPPVDVLDNVDLLIQKIQQNGVKNYVACNLRFHPCIQYLKEFLDLNVIKRINEVNVYCGSYLPDWRPNKDFRKIYSANAEMGGGVHLDLFHELDYTNWMFGNPLTTRVIKRNSSSLNISAVDYANYTLEYKNFTASIVLNYYRRDPKRTIEVLFEDETLIVDLLANYIKDIKGNIIYKAENFNISETYRDQMRYFVKCLTENQKPMNTFAEAIETLKVCLGNG